MTGLVLFESLLWGFARHAHIKAFRHSIELRIGFTESPVLRKHTFVQLNYIDSIHRQRIDQNYQRMGFWYWSVQLLIFDLHRIHYGHTRTPSRLTTRTITH